MGIGLWSREWDSRPADLLIVASYLKILLAKLPQNSPGCEMSVVTEGICPLYYYKMSFCHQRLDPFGKGTGSRWRLTDSLKCPPQSRWQPLKCICSHIPASSPSFFFLFFLRFEEIKPPPQPLVHLPAIRDHKSLRWMELLPSQAQGFDGGFFRS